MCYAGCAFLQVGTYKCQQLPIGQKLFHTSCTVGSRQTSLCTPKVLKWLQKLRKAAGLQIGKLEEALQEVKDGAKAALKAADEQRQHFLAEAKANLQTTEESYQVLKGTWML